MNDRISNGTTYQQYRWFKNGRLRCIVPLCPNIFGYFAKIYQLLRRKRTEQYHWLNAVRDQNELFNECFPPGTDLPYCAGICALHFDENPKDPMDPPSFLLNIEELYCYKLTLLEHEIELSKTENEMSEFFKSNPMVDSDEETTENNNDGNSSGLEIVNQPIDNEIGDENEVILINDEDDFGVEPAVKRKKPETSSNVSKIDENLLDLNLMKESSKALWLIRQLMSHCKQKGGTKRWVKVPPIPAHDNSDVVELSDDETESIPKTSSVPTMPVQLVTTPPPLMRSPKICLQQVEVEPFPLAFLTAGEFPPYLFRLPPTINQQKPVHNPPSPQPSQEPTILPVSFEELTPNDVASLVKSELSEEAKEENPLPDEADEKPVIEPSVYTAEDGSTYEISYLDD